MSEARRTPFYTAPSPPDEIELEEYDNNAKTMTIKWKRMDNCKYIIKSCVEEKTTQTDKSSISRYTLNNVQPGSRYHFQIMSVIKDDENIVSEYSEIVSFSTAPIAPSNLRATPGFISPEKSFNIEFDHDDLNRDYFEVSLRSRLKGKIVLKKQIEDCFILVENLTAGNTYDVWVVAVKNKVESSKCKLDKPIQTRPGKTQNVNTIRTSSTSCTASWDDVFGADSYLVKYKRVDKNFEIIPTKEKEFTIENLDSGQTYKICVAAVTPASNGEYSDVKTFRTDLPLARNIRVESIYSNKSVDVEVTFDSTHEGTNIVTLAAEGGENQRNKRTETNRAVLNSIPYGYSFVVSVHAIASNGTEEIEGIKVYADEPIWIKPSVVAGLSKTAISKNSERVAWKALHGATSYVGKLEEEGKVTEIPLGSGVSYVLTDLKLNTKFSISIAAENKGGIGEFSGPITFQTALSLPSDIKLRNLSTPNGPGIEVTWIGCCEATKYRVELLEAHTNNMVRTHEVNDKCHHQFTDLSRGYKYKARIQCIAEDPKRNSSEAFSQPIWTCPGQVSLVMVNPDTKTSRTIVWENIEGEDVSYELTVKKAGSAPKNYQTSDNSYFLSDLELSSVYTVYVTPQNSGGNGKASNEVRFETALCPPTNLLVSSNSNRPTTAFDILFDEPSVPGHRYLISAINLHGNRDVVDEYRSNNVVVRELRPGESYKVSVTALHATDQTLNSEEITFVTPIWTKLPGFAVIHQMLSKRQYKLTWEEEADSCEVHWRRRNGIWDSQVVNANEVVLDDLEPGENFEAYVVAVNQAGKGEKSKMVYFTTVPPKPLNLRYKILNTMEVEIECDSCHGATGYIFEINDDDYELTTSTCKLKNYDRDRLRVQVCSRNETGESEMSNALEFRQSLNFLRKKFQHEATTIIKKDNFIMPWLKELPGGDITHKFGSEIFEKETILITGVHCSGKTSFCGHYMQTLNNSKLGIYIDYDKIKNIGGKHDFKSLLRKFTPDITSEEMDFVLEWMKTNSEDVVFVIDNFEFAANHAERQVSYGDKELPMHVIQAVLKTNRELFPNSQNLCLSSQSSLQQILNPEKTWEIVGFRKKEIEKMRLKMSPKMEIPNHLRIFCTFPSYCEIILTILKTPQSIDMDMSSCSAVMIELLIKILNSCTEQKRNEKLKQITDDIKAVPNLLKINSKDPEKVKKRKNETSVSDQATSLGFSDLQSYREFMVDGDNSGTNKSCKVLHDYIIIAFYYAFFSPLKEFEKRLQKKAIKFGRNSLIWILASGLLREETMKRSSLVFGSEKINEGETKNKFRVLTKFIKDNMENIWKQIYTESQITLDWLSCCNELKIGDALKTVDPKVRITNETSADEVEKAATFLKHLNGRFCGTVFLKITTDDPTKTLPIDQALRENPFGDQVRMKTETSVKNKLSLSSSFSKKPYTSIRDRCILMLDKVTENVGDSILKNTDDVFEGNPGDSIGSPSLVGDQQDNTAPNESSISETEPRSASTPRSPGANNENINRSRSGTGVSQTSRDSHNTIGSADSKPGTPKRSK